jgi:hypothetical protein
VPFTALLGFARWQFGDRPLLALLVGAVAGGGLLAALYWRFLLTQAQRTQVRGTLAARFGRAAGRGASA